MNNRPRARQVLRTFGTLLLGLNLAVAPVLTYAQHSFGGHASGHFGGGGHFSGGHAAAGHFAAPRFAAPHFAPGVHYAPGAHFAAPGAHFAPRAGAGFARGNGYWRGGRYWGGGYWHGVFWPHVWFNPGFAWFLPILPLGYATFWWAGVPYYYWNNVYYTWDPYYNGYVVTNPPPVADSTSPDTSGDAAEAPGDAGYEQTPPPSAPPASAPPAAYGAPTTAAPATPAYAGGAGGVYLYPRNGQSDQQTQNDRYECHSWAVSQTGFDPTRASAQSSGNAADYRRAMIACLDARGYSAR